VEINAQLVLIVAIVGLVVVVFGLDWADRRRNQRVLYLLNEFLSNPEVNRVATGVSEDTPVGLTFVAPDPPVDPHIWTTYFVGREEMELGADWPVYIVERWERNEIGETRYLDGTTLSAPVRAIDVPVESAVSGSRPVKARSASADA